MTTQPFIVYVEDDTPSQEIMDLLLREVLGYSNFVVLKTTQNFLEVLESLPASPDVILMDINIRPHSGFEVIRWLRNHSTFRDTKVVAVTASIDSGGIEQVRAAGFTGLIGKPIDQWVFPMQLQRILNSEEVWEYDF